MNPKEQFMQQLQQHEEEKAAGKKRLEKDISEFQGRMLALADDIKGWLRDIPQMRVRVEQVMMVDETTATSPTMPSTYQIFTILVTAGERSLKFKPTYLYLMGGKGEVELEYGGVHPAPRYKAYMCDPRVTEGKWALVAVGQNNTVPQELDEAAFFALMGQLIR